MRARSQGRAARIGAGGACALVCLGLVAGATEARAAVTIGSDLSRPVAFGGGPAGPFTVLNRTIPGRPTTAPINGVIARWRVKGSGADWGTLRLRVLADAAADPSYAVVRSSDSVSPGLIVGIEEFATSLPIAAGQRIGLEATNQIQGAVDVPGVLVDYLSPSPADGATAPVFDTNDDEVLFQAEIEPDADCDGLGDETQDPLVTAIGCPHPPPPPGAGHLELELRAAKRKPLRRLNVKASCFEDRCDLRVKGKVVASGDGARRKFRLRPRRAMLRPNEIRKLGLRVAGAGPRRELVELLDERAKTKATITGQAETHDGRRAKAREQVRIIR